MHVLRARRFLVLAIRPLLGRRPLNGHQLGIGLHLWDKDTRERIERKMDLAKASDAKLKAAVYQIARDRLDKTKPTAAEVAKLFGKTTQEMVEPDVNREILKAEGLL